MPKKTKQSKRKNKKFNLWWWLLKWSLIASFWGAAAVAVVLTWYARDLPEIQGFDLTSRKPSIVFLTKDRREIATHGHIYCETVTADKVPTHLLQALIATEDRRFFEHPGIDVVGLARATVRNMISGHVVQGGSTLTQQLVKNIFLSHERSFSRKIQEVILSIWLERHFTKEQILSIYLNRVYLGGGTFGVDAAAQLYFGKLVGHLNLAECAAIAGLLKAPNRYARNHEKLKQRAIVVLHNMREVNYITTAQYEKAKADVHNMSFQIKKMPSYRYFTDWVSSELENLVDTSQDLIVTTTLDSRLQNAAMQSIKTAIKTHGEKYNVQQAAFVGMSFDGAVRALVGGAHYFSMQYNLATQAHRQAGSAFKPVVYLAALEQGQTLQDLFDDSPYTKGQWTANNFGWKDRGEATLAQGLTHSINTVSIRVAEKTGLTPIINMSERLGFSRKPKRNLSIALGTTEASLLELVNAFTIIGNQGIAVQPYGILEVRNAKGDLLYKRAPLEVIEVLDPTIAQTMIQLLQSVVAQGTAKAARLPGRTVAGKTGTTQKFRDAWFIGFTDHLTGGVWMGNPDETPMSRVVGGTLPARLWRDIMMRYSELRF